MDISKQNGTLPPALEKLIDKMTSIPSELQERIDNEIRKEGQYKNDINSMSIDLLLSVVKYACLVEVLYDSLDGDIGLATVIALPIAAMVGAARNYILKGYAIKDGWRYLKNVWRERIASKNSRR